MKLISKSKGKISLYEHATINDASSKNVEIQDDAFNADDKDMIQDMIAMAINEAIEKIDEAEEEINERITGQPGGMGF